MGNLAQITPQQPRELTLNERLNSASDSLLNQCNRIESMLARTNGAPQSGGTIGGEKTAHVRSMSDITSEIEGLAERLCSLASNLERVA